MKWLPNKALEGIAHKTRRGLGQGQRQRKHIRGPSLACGEKEDEKNPFIWECRQHTHTRVWGSVCSTYLQVEIAERRDKSQCAWHFIAIPLNKFATHTCVYTIYTRDIYPYIYYLLPVLRANAQTNATTLLSVVRPIRLVLFQILFCCSSNKIWNYLATKGGRGEHSTYVRVCVSICCCPASCFVLTLARILFVLMWFV